MGGICNGFSPNSLNSGSCLSCQAIGRLASQQDVPGMFIRNTIKIHFSCKTEGFVETRSLQAAGGRYIARTVIETTVQHAKSVELLLLILILRDTHFPRGQRTNTIHINTALGRQEIQNTSQHLVWRYSCFLRRVAFSLHYPRCRDNQLYSTSTFQNRPWGCYTVLYTMSLFLGAIPSGACDVTSGSPGASAALPASRSCGPARRP